jgi:hypothetical protein
MKGKYTNKQTNKIINFKYYYYSFYKYNIYIIGFNVKIVCEKKKREGKYY